MKNLLIIAQKVDAEDDLLGFFIDWIKEFSNNFDNVFVITLSKGKYELPSNVQVYSLGKEHGSSKFVRLVTYYKLLFRLVPKSNGVFAHMSPIFAVSSWPVTFIFRKKIILWYLHRSVTFRLKLANLLCYKIVTAAKESLLFKSNKIIETGHGINIEKFRTKRDWTGDRFRLLSVGRISKIKNYETLIKAAKILQEKNIEVEIKIVGQPVMSADTEYMNYLKTLNEKLALRREIEFVGFVPFSKIADYYKNSDLVVGLTPQGGIDKTILEAMASGCLVLTSNPVNKKYFGSYSDDLLFGYGNPENLAEKIEFLIRMPVQKKEEMSRFLVNSIEENHNLLDLIVKLSRLYI